MRIPTVAVRRTDRHRFARGPIRHVSGRLLGPSPAAPRASARARSAVCWSPAATSAADARPAAPRASSPRPDSTSAGARSPPKTSIPSGETIMTARAATAAGPVPPARTYDDTIALFRRPFAPGAVGFRAMSKVPWGQDPWGGAQAAAYIGAQSVVQRLNCVAPGRWRMNFLPVDGDPLAAAADGHARRRLYLACGLHVTLPELVNGPDVEAVYEDVGELDGGSLAGLKALYSDARKRAGVAAGIGAYLYTALAAVVLPIGPGDRQVQCIRRSGKSDLLVLSSATDAWLRDGYRARMHTNTVLRDLGAILAHGEPDDGIGQGESADAAAHPSSEPPDTHVSTPPEPAGVPNGHAGNGSGELVTIDFGGLGPTTPPAA